MFRRAVFFLLLVTAASAQQFQDIKPILLNSGPPSVSEYLFGYASTVDSEGNLYLGGYSLSSASGTALLKLDPKENKVLYRTVVPDVEGAQAAIAIYGLTVTANGELIAVGQSPKGLLPTGPSSYQSDCPAKVSCAFVMRLDREGKIIAATYIGQSNTNVAAFVASGSNGDIFVSGTTTSSSFPTTADAFQASRVACSHPDRYFSDCSTLFIAVFSPALDRLERSTYFGGSMGEHLKQMSVDADDNVYVSGVTGSRDFPITPGAFKTSMGEIGANFITKLDGKSLKPIFSTFVGSDGFVGGASFGLDRAANIYVVGEALGRLAVTDGTTRNSGVYLWKLDSTASHLLYGSYLDVPGIPRWTFVDRQGNIHIAGDTFSNNFPVKNAFLARNPGNFYWFSEEPTGFLMAYAPDGRTLLYSTYLPYIEFLMAVTQGAKDDVWITGDLIGSGTVLNHIYLGKHDFALEASQSNTTVSETEVALTLTPLSIFNGDIDLKCESSEVICDFDNPHVRLEDSPILVQLHVRPVRTAGIPGFWLLPGIAVLGLFRKRRRVVIYLLSMAMILQTGCALNSLQERSTSVKIVATSGDLQKTTTVLVNLDGHR